MPWAVRKQGNKWAIIRSDTKKVVGMSDTVEKAKASVRARYAATKGKESGGGPNGR